MSELQKCHECGAPVRESTPEEKYGYAGRFTYTPTDAELRELLGRFAAIPVGHDAESLGYARGVDIHRAREVLGWKDGPGPNASRVDFGALQGEGGPQ